MPGGCCSPLSLPLLTAGHNQAGNLFFRLENIPLSCLPLPSPFLLLFSLPEAGDGRGKKGKEAAQDDHDDHDDAAPTAPGLREIRTT